ncbi:5-bromo-4-chloroindolyl phosphate hydrolysis family protein [Roseivivax marinus]|uniref:5-bromo-4-chloroindolyl phosphate hydrolysis family protein n=1 Tax=Roseivivax marinus TaxID=1379903 RepID=UPI001F0351C8|nr:5-bromo-4-chloroindolyl phosphate hydrolysis family protein [Roseivivax marinus]UMA65054.1 5-bromo-4-chloroindolyl phosphate hydrolysis family protein [Roseivivax marinus]
MARRFGGKFSPGAQDAETAAPKARARVNPVGARANMMFVPPVILAFLSLGAGAAGLAFGLLGAGAWLLAAWLLREGLKAEAAYDARRIAHRPALPRKILAAGLSGIGMASAALSDGVGVPAAVVYGVVAGGLQVAAFGIDPLRAKGLEDVDSFQHDRVARVVDDAESYLDQLMAAVHRAGDREVTARAERVQDTARELIRTVEDDPRDLTAARKYLGVYLMGARDAATRFADIYARGRDEAAKRDFLMLLSDLEESFGKKTKTLLVDANSDLQIEIDVLRDRLQREGVTLDRQAQT